MQIAVATRNGEDRILLYLSVNEPLYKNEMVVFESENGPMVGTMLCDSKIMTKETVNSLFAEYTLILPPQKALGKYEYRKFNENRAEFGLYYHNDLLGILGVPTDIVDLNGMVCFVGDVVRWESNEGQKDNSIIICRDGTAAIFGWEQETGGGVKGAFFSYSGLRHTFVKVLDWTSFQAGDVISDIVVKAVL